MSESESENGTAESVPKAVHLQRLNTKISQVQDLTAQVSALRAELESAQAGVAKFEETHASLTQLRAEHAAFVADSALERSILTTGISDAEDIDLVRYRFDKLPAEGRPTLPEWLADGARTDRHLRHLWPAATPEPADPPPEATAQPGGLPSVNGGARPGVVRPTEAMSLKEILALPIAYRNSPEGRLQIETYLASLKA